MLSEGFDLLQSEWRESSQKLYICMEVSREQKQRTIIVISFKFLFFFFFLQVHTFRLKSSTGSMDVQIVKLFMKC